VTEQHTGPGGRPDVGDIPVGTLISEIAQDLSTLMRQELELAKVETKREVTKAGKAGGMLGGAGFAGWMAVLFVSLALMFTLGALIPLGWAALIVAVIWGAVAAVLYTQGRKKMDEVNPVPEKTVETVKEDVRWVQNRSS
jgi:hypothetical protein